MKNENGIAIKNIYYMLSYAFTNLSQQYDDEIAGENFENIHNLLAAILSKGISHQIKQGLYREYVEVEETLYGIKGKINVWQTMQKKLHRSPQAVCQHDELSVDNTLNQILKFVSELLIKHDDVHERYKESLRKNLLFFRGISNIDIKTVRWSTLRYDRNNQTYRMLLGISQLIIEGMLLSEETGILKLAQFVDDQRMCRLYEKFILEYYRKEAPIVRAESSQIAWAVDGETQSLLPQMQSDVMLSYGEKVLIIDAKYYTHTMQTHYDTQTIHSANLYQMFTYVKNKQEDPGIAGHNVVGMLLYAKTDEVLQPNISTKIAGNEIFVRTLDLNQDFKHISAQLNEIVNNIFDINIS